LVKSGHQLVALGSELPVGYVRNVYATNLKSGKIGWGVLGIETDVLYQWRTLVPTDKKRLPPSTTSSGPASRRAR
jgi:hypothetical protein